MAEFPALPLYTDAYMADTRHLTATQHGAYLLLLMTAWRMPDCALPDDDKFLARCASIDGRGWATIKPIVMEFWRKNKEGKWVQLRLNDERKYAKARSDKASYAGSISALKKKERHLTEVELGDNSDSTSLPYPTLKDTPIVPKGDFASFWGAYPLKEGRKKAEAAYDKALKISSHESIMAGLHRYIRSKRVSEGYIKQATTYLNGEHWKDEIQAPVKRKSPSLS